MERINLDKFATETLANREVVAMLRNNVTALTDEALLTTYTWTQLSAPVRVLLAEYDRRMRTDARFAAEWKRLDPTTFAVWGSRAHGVVLRHFLAAEYTYNTLEAMQQRLGGLHMLSSPERVAREDALATIESVSINDFPRRRA